MVGVGTPPTVQEHLPLTHTSHPPTPPHTHTPKPPPLLVPCERLALLTFLQPSDMFLWRRAEVSQPEVQEGLLEGQSHRPGLFSTSGMARAGPILDMQGGLYLPTSAGLQSWRYENLIRGRMLFCVVGSMICRVHN